MDRPRHAKTCRTCCALCISDSQTKALLGCVHKIPCQFCTASCGLLLFLEQSQILLGHAVPSEAGEALLLWSEWSQVLLCSKLSPFEAGEQLLLWVEGSRFLCGFAGSFETGEISSQPLSNHVGHCLDCDHWVDACNTRKHLQLFDEAVKHASQIISSTYGKAGRAVSSVCPWSLVNLVLDVLHGLYAGWGKIQPAYTKISSYSGAISTLSTSKGGCNWCWLGREHCQPLLSDQYLCCLNNALHAR